MAWNPNIPTVTNRVQDDLNAIRENFQHLAPLAQAVDELQAVSGLAPYVQALLDSRIVEMGSNSNGEYVRWENGLQVCWVIDFILSTLAGGGTRLQNTWTYPAAFASKPFVVLNFDAANFSNWEQIWHWRAQRATTTSVAVSAAKNGTATFASGDEVQVGVFAIGFWK